VVDDALMDIDVVVRGADILDSTPRQLGLFAALGYRPPVYAHVPLLVDTAGRKLSKTHRDLELRELRARGISPQAVIGYLAFCAGLLDSPRAVAATELVSGFSFAALGAHDVVVADDVASQLMNMS